MPRFLAQVICDIYPYIYPTYEATARRISKIGEHIN